MRPPEFVVKFLENLTVVETQQFRFWVQKYGPLAATAEMLDCLKAPPLDEHKG